jgi:hypothetical protein
MKQPEPPSAEVLAASPEPEPAEGAGLVDLVLSAAAPAPKIEGVVVGEIAGFDADGEALVIFPGAPGGSPLRARSTTALRGDEAGREVALLFERGDPARPLVMGLMHRPAVAEAAAPVASAEQRPLEATVDGERITFSAAKEIVFRCGEASITLTRAGKILIRGAYVLTRSSGVNRIQGGSVQIN